METVETVERMETVETVETVDNVETVETENLKKYQSLTDNLKARDASASKKIGKIHLALLFGSNVTIYPGPKVRIFGNSLVHNFALKSQHQKAFTHWPWWSPRAMHIHCHSHRWLSTYPSVSACLKLLRSIIDSSKIHQLLQVSMVVCLVKSFRVYENFPKYLSQALECLTPMSVRWKVHGHAGNGRRKVIQKQGKLRKVIKKNYGQMSINVEKLISLWPIQLHFNLKFLSFLKLPH